MYRYLTYSLTVVLVGLLTLTACQNEGGLELNRSRSLAPNQPTCTLDDLEANTAGWHRSGAVGGVGLAENPDLDPALTASLDITTDEITADFPVANLTKDVVLFVADDYGSFHSGGASVYTLDPVVYTMQHSDSDLDTVGELEYALDKMLLERQLSHGAFVLTYTLDLLRSTGATFVSATPDRSETVLSLGGVTVIVRALEVSGLNMNDIQSVFATTSNAYRGMGFENFVYNMSFTLEPCSAVDRFREGGGSSFDPYLAATPPGIGPGDPLYDFIHKNNRDSVFIAAAGNFGQPQPRQPGLMPNVVSVSASEGNSATLFEHSNYGEVMLPGIWVSLRDPFNHNGVGDILNETLLGGTSLAAPVAAAAALLDLASDDTRCATGGDSLLAHGTYNNASLADAVSANCSL